MCTVENAAYKPPEGYSTLARSYHFKDDVTKPGNFNGLPQVARELGFLRTGDFPTERSSWQVFDRPSHDVPNFPDCSTRISSTLALYNTEGKLTRAVLRTSREPYPSDEFARDLAAFTKHFIERPRLLGYPSQELTRIRNMPIAMAIGIVALSAADYYFVQSVPGSAANFGTLMGEMGGPLVYGAVWALSERHARKSISRPEQYATGERAQSTLLGERYHNVTVAIQREIYQALQQEGVTLTPDQFLENIYGQMPQVLVERRHAEVEQTIYPMPGSPRETENSLPRLIKVAHVLQEIESYLNLATELKRGLA